jgi:hypothetical protein
VRKQRFRGVSGIMRIYVALPQKEINTPRPQSLAATGGGI